MRLINFNEGPRAIDQPLHGKDWMIRFEDEMLEIVIRAYRDPSDGYTCRRARAILKDQSLDQTYKLESEVGVCSELFLEGGLQPARSIIAKAKS